MPEAAVQAHLAAMRRPDIDAAERRSTATWSCPKPCASAGASTADGGSAVPTLVVFGRRDHPTTEELLGRLCRDPERYADRLEFAYVDHAAHFITDDAPEMVQTSRSTGSTEPDDRGRPTTRCPRHRVEG
jgi:pimeloyl-ACP methyl ester carboxylesterase